MDIDKQQKKIQIGLGKNWTGLGDLLDFLVILNHCPEKYQLVLSEKMKRFLPLFEGYDVIVDDDILPSNTHLNISSKLNCLEHAYKVHLKNLNIDQSDYIPKFRIDLFQKHSNCDFLISPKKTFLSEVVFVSNCSKTGEHERGFSYERLLSFIRQNKNIFFHHFRLDSHYSFSKEENVAEYTNIDLISYALACNKIGQYVGLNTGDYHFAIASGIKPENSLVLIPSRNTIAKICIAQWIYPKTKMVMLEDEDKMTDKEFLDFVVPKKTDFSPIRLGKNEDGGYVCPKELIAKAKRCFSFGISNDVSFEKDLLKENENIIIDGYDGSIDALPEDINVSFHRENVYFSSSHKKLFSNCVDPYIIKMDIEGEEYNFSNIDEKDLENALFIVFELHWIHNNKEKAKNLLNFFKKAGFCCFHVHGNNCCPNQYAFNEEECPEVLEITLVHGNFTEYSDKKYPIDNIDYKNNKKRNELQLKFISDRQRK